MAFIDWMIVFIVFACMLLIAILSKGYMKSVADFLAGGRCAGRYMISMSTQMASVAAISVIASFEMYYEVGFTPIWWSLFIPICSMAIAWTGWVYYRFRETRALTLAQFFEMRYSRNFRVFSGIVGWVCGIVNFGIFPAVGARFFIHFCGLPHTVHFGEMGVSTYPLVMAILLAISLFFTFIGGQIAVMLTDLFQGILLKVALLLMFIPIFSLFDWSQFIEALETAPEGKSMLNPFQTGKVKYFDVWYHLIHFFGMFYTYIAWQGSQAYNCSAKSPHEAKMGKFVNTWRDYITTTLWLLLPICAFTLMHHADFSGQAATIRGVLDTISPDPDDTLRKQMTVTVALRHFLPVGYMGIFCAIMFSAFVSTHDTYLHSWGSIFVQDVILPFRRKPFSPGQHIWLLRFSIMFVALFIFFFSLLFQQNQHIRYYMALTGTIFLGGAGSAIIGGLYWKRGTTAGAWAAMLAGVILAVGTFVLQRVWPLLMDGDAFPIDSQWMFFISMVTAIVLYVVISLMVGKSEFNLKRMLHRGEYAEKDQEQGTVVSGDRERLFKFSREFSLSDKIIVVASVLWTFTWFAVFVIGTVYNLTHDVGVESWAKLWKIYVGVGIITGVITTVWFTVGSLYDVRYLIQKLRSMKRDDLDDGTVFYKNK